ncbi:hypothetical protein ASG43_13445 [Aureimonas sp. Leaf454]|uniref:peptide chain release factor N(5)-glutamine methyltransferase n=1 Tax=Aureimonas sp. Leaf454 TaxID=1736381 RepID=UPI0007010D62|nr:peptide chain release factor N(5)-glutamine methyltransferase [Aureimonas sp. Leaf454]KQT44357.1 hypothetical protein ASG43_13445 [Aureimonas sp. Leaf454]
MTETVRTLADLLRQARHRLSGIEGGDLDARLLIGDAAGLDAAGLILRGGDPADAELSALVEARVERRLGGEPTHRILGRRAFYDHVFELSPDTLEPRPDTEALVDLCRPAFERHIAAHGSCRFADLGTGTGAIAVTLLALYPQADAIAVDISPGALETAARNAASAGVAARFRPLLSDYASALDEPLDLIVSNPPYIPSAEIARLSGDVRDFDPRRALDGGADGLDAYRRIAGDGARLLHRDGDLLVEIGQGQASDVEECFRRQGLGLVASARDLGGIERALAFRRTI